MYTAPGGRHRLCYRISHCETFEEIDALALRQLSEGGAEAVSLNGIARAMGMSGPGLYRYYASREDLLAALVITGCAQLASALEEAMSAAADLPPPDRLGAVARGYRGWAVAHPRHYELLFGIRPTEYRGDPGQAIDTIHGGMRVLLEIVGELAAGGDSSNPGDELDQELRSWSQRRGDRAGIPPLVLRLGVLAWTRLHGIVSLELTGALRQMNIDPALLIDHEVHRLVTEAQAR